MLTHNLGYPRIGINRDLKKLVESYWKNEIDKEKLTESASALRVMHWTRQKESGIDWVPSNDFSLYDQVLDMAMLTGAVPKRYRTLFKEEDNKIYSYPVDTYFAMARGLQDGGHDIPAMEMTKWFNTNYHYIVPEFSPGQEFQCLSSKIFDEYEEARSVGIITKPVLIGPVSFLLLGKEKGTENGFHRLQLLERLLPVYQSILSKLEQMGAQWVQIDEPYLALDIDSRTKESFQSAYHTLNKATNDLKLTDQLF
jgi:5-methyltetrahydropteroyltriglutamate--homocysteine methyltransferase